MLQVLKYSFRWSVSAYDLSKVQSTSRREYTTIYIHEKNPAERRGCGLAIMDQLWLLLSSSCTNSAIALYKHPKRFITFAYVSGENKSLYVLESEIAPLRVIFYDMLPAPRLILPPLCLILPLPPPLTIAPEDFNAIPHHHSLLSAIRRELESYTWHYTRHLMPNVLENLSRDQRIPVPGDRLRRPMRHVSVFIKTRSVTDERWSLILIYMQAIRSTDSACSTCLLITGLLFCNSRSPEWIVLDLLIVD